MEGEIKASALDRIIQELKQADCNIHDIKYITTKLSLDIKIILNKKQR